MLLPPCAPLPPAHQGRQELCAATLPSAPELWKCPDTMPLLKTCSGLQDPSCLFYLRSEPCVESEAEGLQCLLFKARSKHYTGHNEKIISLSSVFGLVWFGLFYPTVILYYQTNNCESIFCSLLFHLQLMSSVPLSSTNMTELMHQSTMVLLHGELLSLM